MEKTEFVKKIEAAWEKSIYKSLVIVLEGQTPEEGIDIFRGDDAIITTPETEGKIIAAEDIFDDILSAAINVFEKFSYNNMLNAQILLDV